MGGGAGRGRRRRQVTEEEAALWRAVTRHDVRHRSDASKPLGDEADKPAAPPRAAQTAPPVSDPPALAAAPPPRRLKPTGTPQPLVSVNRAPDPVGRLSPNTPGIDRNTARRLRQGRIEPDARIDLHGMTAERAHGALRAFLMREHASGSRVVLVITGKGGRRREPEGYEMRELPEGSGVLKSLTPHWLGTPPLSQLVVGQFQASPKHGGSGALYVYLRKSRR